MAARGSAAAPDSAGSIELRVADPADPQLAQELALRDEVLARPLGLTLAALRFAFEADSLRLWAVRGRSVVGCVLFHRESERAGRLYQMAVAECERGRGIGRALVRGLEERLRVLGVERVRLHARVEVQGFYRALGYRDDGPPFVEVGIEHRPMARGL